MIQLEYSGSSCFNYKKFLSYVLMDGTDVDYKFVYTNIGSYGTGSNSELFKLSAIDKRLSQKRLNIESEKHSPNDDGGDVIPYSIIEVEALDMAINHVLRSNINKIKKNNIKRFSKDRDEMHFTLYNSPMNNLTINEDNRG